MWEIEKKNLAVKIAQLVVSNSRIRCELGLFKGAAKDHERRYGILMGEAKTGSEDVDRITLQISYQIKTRLNDSYVLIFSVDNCL